MKKLRKNKKGLGLFLLRGFKKPQNKLSSKKSLYAPARLQLSRMRSVDLPPEASLKKLPKKGTKRETKEETQNLDPELSETIVSLTQQLADAEARAFSTQQALESETIAALKQQLADAETRVLSSQQEVLEAEARALSTQRDRVSAETGVHPAQELIPVEIPSEPSVSPVQTEFQIFLPSAEKNFLSTADITKPNDKLKQSIEAFLLDQRSPHTKRAYGKDLKRFVKFLHARNLNHGPDRLTRTVLIGYKESLLSDGLQHTSIDRHLATLRSFFKWLVDDGILEKSPADGVRFLNPKKLSTTIGFSDEEVRKILAVPDLHKRAGAQHYAILMILFYCGLRRSELCNLKTSNLGTERNQRVMRLRGKGNAERMIVLTEPIWNALKHYFYITRRDIEKISEDVYLFSPIRNNRTGILEKPLDTSTIFSIVTRYARQAGIMNRVSPHSCRATAISNARDHHVPDRAIQEFAGWASPDMITRYDKRRTSIEESATHSIRYGSENRSFPASGATARDSSLAVSPSPKSSVKLNDPIPMRPSPHEDWEENEK